MWTLTTSQSKRTKAAEIKLLGKWIGTNCVSRKRTMKSKNNLKLGALQDTR